MADSQPTTSTHRKVLENKLDKETADAIVGVAREEALAVFREKKEEIRELIADQLNVKQRAEELPPADKAAVIPQVNDASRQVREVAEDAQDIDARQRADEPVDPQEVRDLDERAIQARQSSDQAAAAVERKAAAATRVRQEHEAQQASAQPKQPATSTPAPSRDDADQGNDKYVTQVQFKAALEQVDARSRDAKNDAVRALAIARASASSESPTKRGSSWAIGTFVTVFLLYLVIWGVSGSLEHRWFNQFAWPFGFGAVAFWLGAFTAHTSRNDDTSGQHSDEDQHGDHPIWEGDRDHDRSTRTDNRAHA